MAPDKTCATVRPPQQDPMYKQFRCPGLTTDTLTDLNRGHPKAPGLQQDASAAGCDTLAKSAHHAARHQHILHIARGAARLQPSVDWNVSVCNGGTRRTPAAAGRCAPASTATRGLPYRMSFLRPCRRCKLCVKHQLEKWSSSCPLSEGIDMSVVECLNLNIESGAGRHSGLRRNVVAGKAQARGPRTVHSYTVHTVQAILHVRATGHAKIAPDQLPARTPINALR